MDLGLQSELHFQFCTSDTGPIGLNSFLTAAVMQTHLEGTEFFNNQKVHPRDVKKQASFLEFAVYNVKNFFFYKVVC